jgi:hypothetical protein
LSYVSCFGDHDIRLPTDHQRRHVRARVD